MKAKRNQEDQEPEDVEDLFYDADEEYEEEVEVDPNQAHEMNYEEAYQLLKQATANAHGFANIFNLVINIKFGSKNTEDVSRFRNRLQNKAGFDPDDIIKTFDMIKMDDLPLSKHRDFPYICDLTVGDIRKIIAECSDDTRLVFSFVALPVLEHFLQ